ncbi:MAG: hypothetical protein ABI361_14180 [Nitrososphaera sp.]
MKSSMNQMHFRNARVSCIAFSLLSLLSLALAALPAGTVQRAFAMGDNPTSCDNRYDATVTSVVIQTSRQNIDVLAEPSAVIRQKAFTGYDMTITLHAQPISSAGNTNPGSVWYSTSAFGYSLGTCVSGALASHDIVVTLHNVFMGQANPNGITKQIVTIGSWPNTQQASYRVVWHP